MSHVSSALTRNHPTANPDYSGRNLGSKAGPMERKGKAMKRMIPLLTAMLLLVGCASPVYMQPTYYQPPPRYYMVNGQLVQAVQPPQVVYGQQPAVVYYDPVWPAVGCLPLLWMFDPWFYGYHGGYYHGGYHHPGPGWRR